MVSHMPTPGKATGWSPVTLFERKAVTKSPNDADRAPSGQVWAIALGTAKANMPDSTDRRMIVGFLHIMCSLRFAIAIWGFEPDAVFGFPDKMSRSKSSPKSKNTAPCP